MALSLLLTSLIIAIGIFLFVKEYFSIDTTSILIMALFIVSGVLSPEEGFSGFNHPATITLGCMFVVSAGVFQSGLLDGFGKQLIRLAKMHYLVVLAAFCATAALFSAFVNDTAVVALLLPIALEVSRKTDIPPSRLLIPIAFSSLFGGTCTLIGTSTNILVSSYAEKYGIEGFGMFEFSLAALCLAVPGFLYLLLAGPILLPKRGKDDVRKEAEKYLTEILLREDSPEAGKPLQKTRLQREFDVQVLSIKRGSLIIDQIDATTLLQAGDILKILLPPLAVNELRKLTDYKLSGVKELQHNAEEDKEPLTKEPKTLYEAVIPFGSRLSSGSLRSLNFRRLYSVSVIAIRHREALIVERLSDTRLQEGDLLLLLGYREEVERLEREKLIVVLSSYDSVGINLKKAIPALFIAAGVVLAAALNLTSILISSMIGALLLLLTGTLKPKEAYEAVEWKVIFMIAGVLSMGTALEKTGGAVLIASFLDQTLGDFSPQIALAIVYGVTFLSTNVLSSKAAAALMTPIVIHLSRAMEVSDRPFLIAVMFACSLTFMTPVSYPVNTMVYAPGGYRFNDFLKIGTPLNLLIWALAVFVIPYFFPFQ